MEYNSYKNVKYYKECAVLAEGLGFKLADLKIIPAKTVTKVSATICSSEPDANVGVDDCAKVHRILLSRLEALLGTEEISMELASPGIEHNIKNAAEFEIFIGKNVRVWDKSVSAWRSGFIKSADEKSVTLENAGAEIFAVPYENIAKAKFLSQEA